MRPAEDIQNVVRNGLCTGCGTCAGLCPSGAVRMGETPGGLLLPTVDEAGCVRCGLCAKVCPGAHLDAGLLPAGVDPLVGAVTAAHCGRACDRALLPLVQSGGVVSALLIHLLESGRIDGALVSVMPRNGSLRPMPVLARSRAQVLQAAGSKYCPVPVNAALSDCRATRRMAVVGLGCHVQGLRLAMRALPEMESRIALVVGLFCDRTLLFGAVDHLLGEAGVASPEAVHLEYRSKKRSGWPGEVLVVTAAGRERFLPAKARTRIKNVFTPYRCRLCFDKLNLLSDVAVGDPHGLEHGAEDASAVLVRSARGAEALRSAAEAQALELRPAQAASILAGQAIERKRQGFAAYLAACREMGRVPPECGIDARWLSSGPQLDRAQARAELEWSLRIQGAGSALEAISLAQGRLGKPGIFSRMIRAVRAFLRPSGRHVQPKDRDRAAPCA